MKDTFDKVVMDETRQEEIRAGLMKKRKAKTTWLAPVAAIAAAIAVIMIVPSTRKVVVNAASSIIAAITVNHNDSTIKVVQEHEFYEEDDINRFRTLIEIDSENGYSYAQEKDGRKYFVLDGKWTDVTDYCKGNKYFKYEERYKDGTKMMIFVGGEGSDFGYGQVFLNKDGEVMASYCDLEKNPEWLEKAFSDEKLTVHFTINGSN